MNKNKKLEEITKKRDEAGKNLNDFRYKHLCGCCGRANYKIIKEYKRMIGIAKEIEREGINTSFIRNEQLTEI